MSLLVGIDGTSGDAFGVDATWNPTRNEDYDATFANSFVKRICGRSAPANTMYLRGPGFSPVANNLVMGAIQKGLTFIVSRRSAGVDEPILLTGYSRGAAGVIVLARYLWIYYKIDVKAMLLFNCVNRDLDIGQTDTMWGENVGHVFHVMRDIDASGSPRSFGYSGMHPSPPADYKQQYFFCTHGAMGGTPWPMGPGNKPNDKIVEGRGAFAVKENSGGPTNVTYEQDARGAELVQSLLNHLCADTVSRFHRICLIPLRALHPGIIEPGGRLF